MGNSKLGHDLGRTTADKNTPPRQSPELGREEASTGKKQNLASSPLSQEHLEQVSKCDVWGYNGPGGVSIHSDEIVELFNLLEANPRDWNRRLRIVSAGWILYLQSEGILDGHWEVTERLRHQPHR